MYPSSPSISEKRWLVLTSTATEPDWESVATGQTSSELCWAPQQSSELVSSAQLRALLTRALGSLQSSSVIYHMGPTSRSPSVAFFSLCCSLPELWHQPLALILMPNASSTKQPLRGTFEKKKAAISSESAGVAAFLCLWRWQTCSLQRGNGTTINRLFLLHTAFR